MVRLFLLISVLTVPSFALAGDVWTTPFAGVRRLHRTTSNPWRVNVLVVDLATPGIRLSATKSADRRKSPSVYAKAVGAQAAVNGDFFSYSTYATSCLAAGSGAKWTDTSDNSGCGNLAFGTGRTELYPPSQVVAFDPTWMSGVVSGHPAVLANGVVLNKTDSFCTARHPRTALGLSQDKKTLYVLVVDGRQSSSIGMTCMELGTQLKGLGAHTGLNLDGGGSSAMYLAGTGVVNSPSDGSERVVANHLAIFAPGSSSVGTLTGAIYEGSTTTARIVGATVKVTGGPTDISDASGLYSFNLAPGQYTVTATKSGYLSASVTRTVTTGQTIWGSISMTKSVAPTDLDSDGVVDGSDNCPDKANSNQANKDGDALGDVCDGDDDGDNVFDEDDNCPFLSNADQADADGDELGDACDPTNNPTDAGVVEEPVEEDAGVVADPEADGGVSSQGTSTSGADDPAVESPVTGCNASTGGMSAIALLMVLAATRMRRRTHR